MRPLPLLFLLGLAGLAFGQPESPHFTADRIVRDGAASKVSGHVQVRSGPYRLQGDQGTVNSENKEIDLRGHARITLPARADRIFVRYASSVLVSAEDVVISADHLHFKNGLLRGTGHVGVEMSGKGLQADEIEVFVNIGDGKASGNLRLNGAQVPPPGARTFRPADRRAPFPPDIVKQ
jgi:lipopolysaccharide export system protein LptA